MSDNFTNNNNTADEKKTLKDIQELLERNKISADDIIKLSELEIIKQKKKDIQNLIEKFENDLFLEKIEFKKVDEILTNLIEQLKDKRKKKRNKKTTVTENNQNQNEVTEEIVNN